MRRVIVGLVLLAVLGLSISPSSAQFADPDRDKAEKADRDQVDQQYKSTLRKVQNGKATDGTRVDPWSNMRSNDAAKPKR